MQGLNYSHGDFDDADSQSTEEGGHHGFHRARLCKRLFLLGLHIHSYTHRRGRYARAAAGRNAVLDCGRDSDCLVPRAWIALAVAAERNADSWDGRAAAFG